LQIIANQQPVVDQDVQQVDVVQQLTEVFSRLLSAADRRPALEAPPITMQRMTVLSIADRGLILDTAADADAFLQLISCPEVNTLILRGNSFSSDAFLATMRQASGLKKLTALDAGDIFTGRDRRSVHQAIFGVAQLVLVRPLNALVLADNAIGTIGLASLVPALGHSFTLSIWTYQTSASALVVASYWRMPLQN
jgi:hypothetical protein